MWQSTYFLNLEIYWNWKVFLKCQINTLIMEFQIRQKLLRKYFMKIMRTAARCRELKTVSITWNVHIQKRWLLCNINELYFKFQGCISKHQYLSIYVCKSATTGSHSVCVWAYHQNVKLILDACKFPKYKHSLIKMIVCSRSNYECMI